MGKQQKSYYLGDSVVKAIEIMAKGERTSRGAIVSDAVLARNIEMYWGGGNPEVKKDFLEQAKTRSLLQRDGWLPYPPTWGKPPKYPMGVPVRFSQGGEEIVGIIEGFVREGLLNDLPSEWGYCIIYPSPDTGENTPTIVSECDIISVVDEEFLTGGKDV